MPITPNMQKGFSLIELMITLAIIGVLAALGYPSWTSHLQQTRCRQANTALHQLAARLEHFAALHGNYLGANRDNLQINPLQKNLHYQLQLSQLNQHHFVITATAKAKPFKAVELAALLACTGHLQHQMLPIPHQGAAGVHPCWRRQRLALLPGQQQGRQCPLTPEAP